MARSTAVTRLVPPAFMTPFSPSGEYDALIRYLAMVASSVSTSMEGQPGT